MSDPLEQDALGGSREFSEPGIAGCSLRAAELHLDEFMVVKGTFGFGDDRRGHSGIADEQNRIQFMSQAPKIFALTF